jgi:hypothetical protein
MKDPRVDEYIAAQPEWQKAVLEQIRGLIHQAEPKIKEMIKFTNRPYFVYKRTVCAFLATKDHINIFIYDPIAPDPENIINQGQGNATARAIQIYEHQKINTQAFTSLIRAVVKNNKAGGWRKLSK